MARSIATNRTVDLSELLDFVRPRRHLLLATTRRDGRPQVSPVSGGIDGQGRIVVSTYPGRAKTRNAERDARVSVLVLS
ncbi:MAG: PPOX class F420-dependent oxidoreductase, partial [Cellulomonadaceae bacterium]|nr:PPOX class F420-dependent oxidoreductase [Cellulomonadaceae bacterium]